MTPAARQRKLAALRRLAARPGTPEEGAAARDAIRRMEAASTQAPQPAAPLEDPFRPQWLSDMIEQVFADAVWEFADGFWDEVKRSRQRQAKQAAQAPPRAEASQTKTRTRTVYRHAWSGDMDATVEVADEKGRWHSR